ncbi:glutaredoxin family protein [uncultured Psychrobacter sp.]|uniref:glutaredoxin family protein n=1 Tax=uncultured Psychrobacter sp. TaxID=259303 RepID=UPI00345A87FC
MSINIDHYEHTNTRVDSSVKDLRTHIATAIPNLDKPRLATPNAQNSAQDWWLLGTSGCHLCEVAEQILKHLQAVEPITYRYVDIADFDEALMMAFATNIPVILTKDQRLDYPFSVLDLQQLL